MSQRGKRGNRLDNETQQPPSKRRKGRPPAGTNFDNDNEISAATIPVVSAGVQAGLGTTSASNIWQARSISDLKISSIYNRSSSEAPAELFRKDLISAMKLPDSEPLSTDEYWIITDQWKQEWEKGVQVPVNPDSLPEPCVKLLLRPIVTPKHDFKLPKNKYVRITKDDTFSPDMHYMSNAPAMAESACAYDLDQIDEVWLKLLNNERALCGAPPISDGQFERVIEELEIRCWDKIQAIMKSEEGLGIEYDENVICDVCRSPDSEEANEMVFCDNCNICVHQACYGITTIPSGQWLCRTCSMGERPDCVLCPNKGGAMKSTRSGKKWAHVSCALWIPEVSIGCVDRMEPITKISSIPQSRWALICVLCRERVGACIQCSVKTCKTAYHVTCAFQHGLEMRAIIEEGNAEDGVKLRSYCLKHSVSKGKKDNKCTNNNGVGSGSDDDECKKRKMRKDMTSEERNQVRVLRLQEVEAEFDKHVNIKDISCHLLDVDQEAILCIYNYWILKRKSRNNRALIPPKVEDVDMVPSKQEQEDIEKRKMVVHLRQDLERVRNLCYMVNRREKLSRSFFKMREQIFYKQIAVLSDNSCKDCDESFINAVINANNGNSIYDKFYSNGSTSKDSDFNLEDIQRKLTGFHRPAETSIPRNNAEKFRNLKYKKIHVNGISDRKGDDSVYEESLSSNSDYSSDGEQKRRKKKSPNFSKCLQRRKRRKSGTNPLTVVTSSDDDQSKGRSILEKKNSPLHQMEKELVKEIGQIHSSSNESDEILSVKKSDNRCISKKSMKPIYSDSDSTDKERVDNIINDSQQQTFRTKAAMKEFTLQSQKSKHDMKKIISNKEKNLLLQKQGEQNVKRREKNKKLKSPEMLSDGKKNDDTKIKTPKCQVGNDFSKTSEVKKLSTDLLVVPQRQAAKKASENMRSTHLYSNSTQLKKEEKQKEEKDVERLLAKEKDKYKDIKDDEKDKEKERERAKPRGRPPKFIKEERESQQKEKSRHELKNAEQQSEPECRSNIENKNNLLVAYVPQRQAAKKAAEHIKSGMGKSIIPETFAVSSDDKEKEKGEKYSEKDAEKEIEKKVEKNSNKEKKSLKVKENSSVDKKKKWERKIPPAIVLTSSSSESSCCSSSCNNSSSEESDVEKEKRNISDNPRSSLSVINSQSADNNLDTIDIASENDCSVRNAKLAEQVHLEPNTVRNEGETNAKEMVTRNSETNFCSTKAQEYDCEINCKKIEFSINFTSSNEADSKENSSRDVLPNIALTPKSNIKVLEEEIAQRKAEISTLAISHNKTNKSSVSLDKLLNKKERKLHESIESKSMKISEISKSKDNTYNKNEFDAMKTVNENALKLTYTNENSPEVIDIDSESIESIKSKSCQKDNEINKNGVTNQQAEDSDQEKSYLKDMSLVENECIRDESGQKRNENNFLKIIEKDDVVHSTKSSETKANDKQDELGLLRVEQNEIFSSTCDFNVDPLFEIKQNEDDSARETMNLVEKLRQKYKRGSSFGLKSEEYPAPLESRENDGKSNANYSLLHNTNMNIINEKRQNTSHDIRVSTTLYKKDIQLNDGQAGNKGNSESVHSNLVSFTSNNLNFIMKNQSNNQQNENNKDNAIECENQSKSYGRDKVTTKIEQLLKPTDCYDNATTSNFFKDDFVEVQEKDNTSLNAGTSKLDCDYDENTRMQSPYMNSTNIWNENDLIQTRRSVSSSPSSISESNDDLKEKTHLISTNTSSLSGTRLTTVSCDTNLDKNTYHALEPFDVTPSQFPMQQHPNHHQSRTQSMVNGVDMISSYNFSEGSQYNGAVSLFPAQAVSNLNVQMQFPSPGAAIFPPSLSGSVPVQQDSQSSNHLFGDLTKENQNLSSTMGADDNSAYPLLRQTCAAAFTSSSHNLALTAAIVSTSVGTVAVSSPQIISTNNFNMQTDNNILSTNEQDRGSVGHLVSCDIISNSNVNTKDSPSKRTSARFNQQIKSPQMHKSPGKSPRQMELLSKQNIHSNAQKVRCDGGRQRTRSTRGSSNSRVRGRGRGRGRLISISQIPSSLEFDNPLGSIHNNLAGTVYDLDFDEDFGPCNVENLKSLRDRRRSFDCRNTQNNADQKFCSPNYHGKLRNSASHKPASIAPISLASTSESTLQTSHSLLHNIVHPVLPGPVDMRTYSSGFESQGLSSQESYSSHLLGAFATGTADQTLQEIDEEVEKEFQSALKASGTIRSRIISDVIPELQGSIETTSEEISIDSDTTNTKASLSDSRNQLKLKIKGPLAHPDNYNSSIPGSTLNQNMCSQNINLQMPCTSQSSTSNTTGTSSLRRMRKKELLRQYWTQDMNMDNSACLPSVEIKTNTDQSANRCVGIPKAVDSMSSIPTKDDYKDYTAVDPRKRKKLPGLSRELRQLDMPYDIERPERRRSACSSGSNISSNNLSENIKVSGKRRGKSKPVEPSPNGETPKLKIKIKNNIIESSDGRRVTGCPPKKRLTNISVPSLEILKRDCMNFRKQVMADFDEEEKVKRSKFKSKKEHKASHKRKKKEKHSEMQVIGNRPDAPKIIIRIGKRKAQSDMPLDQEGSIPHSHLEITTENQSLERLEGEKPLLEKLVVPIRLKIARNSDGHGYVIGDAKVSCERKSHEKYESLQNSSDKISVSSQESKESISTNNPAVTGATFNVISAAKVNDLKGQNKASKGCPLLPLNKDCEVR